VGGGADLAGVGAGGNGGATARGEGGPEGHGEAMEELIWRVEELEAAAAHCSRRRRTQSAGAEAGARR